MLTNVLGTAQQMLCSVLNFTAPLIEKPFVHLMSVPDDIDNWFTGKEKVKPSSLCLPTGRWNSSPSVSTNLANAAAMKSNSSCNNNSS